jgi:hypothetical protein
MGVASGVPVARPVCGEVRGKLRSRFDRENVFGLLGDELGHHSYFPAISVKIRNARNSLS